MSGGQGQTQASAADRHRRWTDRRRPAAGLAQTAGQAQRSRVIADDQRLDRADGIGQPQRHIAHPCTELTDAGGQDFPPLLALIATNDPQRRAQRHRLGGRHGGAVDQMTGKLQQIIGHRFAAQYRRAAHPKRLTEGDHQQIRAHPLRGAASTPFLTNHADAVGVIRQQYRPGGLRCGMNGRQRRAVAVHTENAFSHH